MSKNERVTIANKLLDRFFDFCEAREKFYVNPSWLHPNQSAKFEKCCGDFFNPDPFFSTAGTCFTSTIELTEDEPSTYNSIRIWMIVEKENSPSKAKKCMEGKSRYSF